MGATEKHNISPELPSTSDRMKEEDNADAIMRKA